MGGTWEKTVVTEICISEHKIFIVDTNKPMQSVAAALCAYCTGFVSEDEEEVVASLADEANEEWEDQEKKNPFLDLIIEQYNDEKWRAYSVWPSRLWGANEQGDYALVTSDNYTEYSYPAGNSVGIYFQLLLNEEMPQVLLDILKERATRFFLEKYPKLLYDESLKDVKIEGFRLVSHIKTAREIQL
jgi:hypothetical protein